VDFYRSIGFSRSNGSISGTNVFIPQIKNANFSGVFKVLPIFALSFTCQAQFFVIYASIADASNAQMLRIMKKTIGLVGFVYIYVGFFGYSLFQEDVKGNMLLNFPRDNILQLTKLGFAMSVIVGFPLMIYPCRQSIFTCFVQPSLAKPTYETLGRNRSRILNQAVCRGNWFIFQFQD